MRYVAAFHRLAGLVCLLLTQLAAAAHAGAPIDDAADLLAGFGHRVEEVFGHATIEGRSVSTLRFHSRIAPPGVLSEARRAFSRRGWHETVTAANGAWQIVSARTIDAHWTVQARSAAGGGSVGLLTVWHTLGRELGAQGSQGSQGSRVGSVAGAAGTLATWLPPDAVVLRHLSSVDAGRRSETLVAVAPRSRASTAQHLIGAGSSAGFVRQARFHSRQGARDANAIVLHRGGVEVALTLVDGERGTSIVIHRGEAAR